MATTGSDPFSFDDNFFKLKSASMRNLTRFFPLITKDAGNDEVAVFFQCFGDYWKCLLQDG